MIECFHVCQVTFVEVTINFHHLKNQLSLLQYEKPPIIICNSLPFHSKTNKTLKTQMVVQGTAFSLKMSSIYDVNTQRGRTGFSR